MPWQDCPAAIARPRPQPKSSMPAPLTPRHAIDDDSRALRYSEQHGATVEPYARLSLLIQQRWDVTAGASMPGQPTAAVQYQWQPSVSMPFRTTCARQGGWHAVRRRGVSAWISSYHSGLWHYGLAIVPSPRRRSPHRISNDGSSWIGNFAASFSSRSMPRPG